jgi:hypothetical protein
MVNAERLRRRPIQTMNAPPANAMVPAHVRRHNCSPMERLVRPQGNVRPAIVSTAFVAIRLVPEAAKPVRRRKSSKAPTAHAGPLPPRKIRTANASADIAMVRAPAFITTAPHVLRHRNVCPGIAPMEFVAAMLAPEHVWPVQPPNAGRA